MSKAVLISIQPKWCSLIAQGKKTVEVRKSRPKIETPFKCYIYCTNNRSSLWILRENLRIFGGGKIATLCNAKDVGGAIKANGKIIGEFVCDKINKFSYDEKFDNITLTSMSIKACLRKSEIEDYANGQYMIYGWHISDLVIYDKPKELSEFYSKCNEACEKCDLWQNVRVNADEYDMECSSDFYAHKSLKRPPQSWCYVEEREQNE